MTTTSRLGIVGGLGSLAGGDLFYKLVKSRAVLEDQDRYHFLFEQHPFKDVRLPLDRHASMTARKFYVFQVCKTFEDSGVDAVLLPCFASQTFREEIQQELGIPVLDMMQALVRHIHHAAHAFAQLHAPRRLRHNAHAVVQLQPVGVKVV